MNWIRDAHRANIGDEGKESDAARIFSSESRACDFSTALHAVVPIIFLLTSFPVDSIHQSVATKHRCEIP